MCKEMMVPLSSALCGKSCHIIPMNFVLPCATFIVPHSFSCGRGAWVQEAPAVTTVCIDIEAHNMSDEQGAVTILNCNISFVQAVHSLCFVHDLRLLVVFLLLIFYSVSLVLSDCSLCSVIFGILVHSSDDL